MPEKFKLAPVENGWWEILALNEENEHVRILLVHGDSAAGLLHVSLNHLAEPACFEMETTDA